jgi:arylsulfatase A-like enzyme
VGRWIPPDLAALGGSTHQHIAGYYGMVKRLDEALGRLLDALRSLDLAEDTIVLFTSDHGCHFKTRNAEYKRSCHESSIRVPTALQGPGFDGGGQIRQLVNIVDLSPTLLDAAGLPVPDGMEGCSILPLVRGETEGWPEEALIQISESQVGRAVRTHRWKYGVTAPDKDGQRDSASEQYVEEYLYDLRADPYELANLIGLASHREVAAVMRERLIRRMVGAGEAEPAIEPAPTRPSGQRCVSSDDAHA